MELFNTMPSLLGYVSRTHHNAQAFNRQEGAKWVHISTKSFVEQTHRMALGLVALGLKRGQPVGILATPSPWWLMADMAIAVAGGISVPLFTTSSDPNLKFKIRQAGVKLAFVSDQAMAQRFRGCRRFFSKVIIQGDGPHKGPLMGGNQLMHLGERLSINQPTLFQDLCEQVRPDDVATIIYTSGTSGNPKGVILTHRNLIAQLHALTDWFKLDRDTDRALSLLPLAHIFERMVAYLYISQGVSIWFIDHPNSLGKLITQVRPTCMTVVPRVLEKIYASMALEVEALGPVQRALGRWGLNLDPSQNDRNRALNWRYQLAKTLVYPKMKQALGGRLRAVISGGAALSPALCRFFIDMGVPVYQGYGLTEASPVINTNYPGHNKIGTVGLPLPGVEVQISSDSEILARGPNIMAGYYKDALATNRAIDADGWLHTGDLGRLDAEGYLTITGRSKDMHKTTTGKYVCPVPIEMALRASPLIDRAYVIAENRTYPTCLIFPDMAQVRRMVGTSDTRDLGDDQLVRRPELQQQINQVLEGVNNKLEPWEQIKKYRVITEHLSIANGDLTPTQKLRRRYLEQRYQELIASMYNGHNRVSKS